MKWRTFFLCFVILIDTTVYSADHPASSNSNVQRSLQRNRRRYQNNHPSSSSATGHHTQHQRRNHGLNNQSTVQGRVQQFFNGIGETFRGLISTPQRGSVNQNHPQRGRNRQFHTPAPAHPPVQIHQQTAPPSPEQPEQPKKQQPPLVFVVQPNYHPQDSDSFAIAREAPMISHQMSTNKQEEEPLIRKGRIHGDIHRPPSIVKFRKMPVEHPSGTIPIVEPSLGHRSRHEGQGAQSSHANVQRTSPTHNIQTHHDAQSNRPQAVEIRQYTVIGEHGRPTSNTIYHPSSTQTNAGQSSLEHAEIQQEIDTNMEMREKTNITSRKKNLEVVSDKTCKLESG